MTQDNAASRVINLCLDAVDPQLMARFWAAALGWEIAVSDGDVGLVPTDDTRFGILFEQTAEQKRGRNNIHLDLTSTSIEDQYGLVKKLIGLGARHIEVGQGGDEGQPSDEGHFVLADPEGNEFCIIEPNSKWHAGCGRLGVINADGTRKVGQFWSEVLGWPLFWDQDEETAIRAPDRTGPILQWSGPPLMKKFGKNRLHIDIAPPLSVSQDDEVDRLLSLGATRTDVGHRDVSWVVLADPDDNEFCVLSPR